MTQETQTKRHKQAVCESAQVSVYCQAQASIHNLRASCNGQCDECFPHVNEPALRLWIATGAQRQDHMLLVPVQTDDVLRESDRNSGDT